MFTEHTLCDHLDNTFALELSLQTVGLCVPRFRHKGARNDHLDDLLALEIRLQIVGLCGSRADQDYDCKDRKPDDSFTDELY
jgi:hypothetical protein